jgi:hypothetical protein
MRRLFFLFVPLAPLAAMSCNANESGTLQLIYGADDPFDASDGPAPTSILVAAQTDDPDGGPILDGGWSPSEPLVESAYPVSTLNLPQESTDDVDTFQVTLYDSADAAIIFGNTLPVQLGGISGLTALDIFVQRTGEFARLPSPFLSVPLSPIASVFEGRFVLVADGSGSSGATVAQLYDLLLWGLVENPEGGMGALTLPCPPLSMAPITGTTFMFLICNTTDANTKDLVAYGIDISGTSPAATVTAPKGDTWRDLAGGSTVVSPNGDVFIVGATRSPHGPVRGPTTEVLRLPTASELVGDGGFADGGPVTVNYSFFNLNFAREGATAVWSAPLYGLVVIGGNSNAGDPGIEYFPSDLAEADGGSPVLSMPLMASAYDPTQGAGGTAIGQSQILVAGGTLPDGSVAPVRLFDLAGGSLVDCESSEAGASDGGPTEGGRGDAGAEGDRRDAGDGGPTEGGEGDAGQSAPVGVPLLTAQGFTQPGAAPMFIGAEKDDTTHAFLVPLQGTMMCPSPPLEVPLRVPNRKGTTAILSPLPSVLVIGGDGADGGNTMESYIPVP